MRTDDEAYVTVIGDVVGSRQADPDLFDRLQDALERTNARIHAMQPLQVTVGDEFQAVYRRLGDALNAAILVRLLLHETAEIRFGVGWGTFTRWNSERSPFEQDGPAWWAARDALKAIRKQESGFGVPAGWRTGIRLRHEPPSDGEGDLNWHMPVEADDPQRRSLGMSIDAAVESLVMLRDHVFARLDERDVQLVLALLADGVTVTEAARSIGISQQAASRRLQMNGGYALLRSWRIFEGSN